MVFENKGSLRYHALWAYTGLSALALALDKIPLPDVQALAVILGPLGVVATADIIKHRNKTQ